jgi:hypothetical protein
MMMKGIVELGLFNSGYRVLVLEPWLDVGIFHLKNRKSIRIRRPRFGEGKEKVLDD